MEPAMVTVSGTVYGQNCAFDFRAIFTEEYADWCYPDCSQIRLV